MFTLPLADSNSQAVESVLDEELYYIILDWNDSGQYWTMTVRNSAFRTLVAGICVAPNFPFVQQFKYPDVFPGELMASIDKMVNGPPPRDGFISKGFELIYVPYVEMVRINSAV